MIVLTAADSVWRPIRNRKQVSSLYKSVNCSKRVWETNKKPLLQSLAYNNNSTNGGFQLKFKCVNSVSNKTYIELKFAVSCETVTVKHV